MRRWFIAVLALVGCGDSLLLGPLDFIEDPSIEDKRLYNLKRLNEIRDEYDLPPLVMDECLNKIAELANDERIETDELHGMFSRECLMQESCECDWAQENQGDAYGMGSWQEEMDVVLEMMMDEGPGGGHHDNIVSTEWTRVGIGIRIFQDVLYFTNDFGL